ncbi:major facilitator superfamily domain-containing protein [Mycena floridula]|nr:major facilitator superfamily domain-containing protein [Mycena floridula]
MQGYGDDSIQVESIYVDISDPVLFTAKGDKQQSILTDVKPVTDSASISSGPLDSDRYWWKLDIQLLPITITMFFFSVLDRSNVANAVVAGLLQSLHLSSYDYSLALTITFIPYILIEIPSGLMMKRYGAPYLLCAMIALGGLITTVQGFITDKRGLIVCRFFIGLFEGGVQPGAVFYLASFYPRYKLQWRVGVSMACIGITGIFASLIAAAIQENMDGSGGRTAWSWIFILEGAASIFCGLVLFFVVPRSPQHARFLSREEKEQLVVALNSDPAYLAQDHGRAMWRQALSSCLHPHLWLLAVIAFLVGASTSDKDSFIPTIVQNAGHKGSNAQLFSAIIAAVSLVVTMLVSYLSDIYQSRGALLIVSAMISIAGYTLFFAAPHAPKIRYGALFLMSSGTFSVSPTFLVWIANNALSQTERATSLAIMAIFQNAGGILAVWLFGSLSVAPAYSTAALTMVIFMCIVLILTIINMVWLHRQNAKRDESAFLYSL